MNLVLCCTSVIYSWPWLAHSTRVPSASTLMLFDDDYISTIPGSQGI